ncbi:disease resistance protein L6-like [Cornus florida]|uniref:disease resistance protein L6-like n=1 Tax=Cornus florida TaxID=4283 RepID=UPI002899D164|nr:disease resistance protein L6-like [Cornus florida]XP_059642495.1 disease resistance protein L6-like [Cornus florida]
MMGFVSEMDLEACPSKWKIESEMDSEEGPITPLRSSSKSLPLPGGEYEVFLSFRGSDTRYAFTDFLYTHLKCVGVRTFRDDNELRRGEEIGSELHKAISESQILIPIFSKNYASSKWCLRELAQMVDHKRTTGQLILPIFYDVEPSDVRHQSGTYEEAFREHERCFDERTIVKWKEALKEVGALKGWEVNKEADGYQGKLIKDKIVPTVLFELKKNYMVLTENLVGINHHENEMMRLLDVDSNDVRIVGIHGMGGIGKTTIAKFIYNKLLDCFDCSSFLADVRETVQQHMGGFGALQNKLLTDTLKCQYDIPDVHRGITMIKHSFFRKKVLIVLDDMDEKSQFDWLVGNCDWFGAGSRIIVTSRDKHVLNALKVNASYEPPFMNSAQSLQLFSMHAFRSKFPPKDYDTIAGEVASTAAGLPLALEVIGSFLSDKEFVVWEDTLKKLEKIPHDEVEKKLRISYDALNSEQQQIFLDIACLFFGMDKATVFYMWDDCSYHPKTEFSVLCLMSLVKVGDSNELRMHNQLKALGRKIVYEEKIPGKRSRLWNHEEALDILEGRMGTEMVEALSLRFELGSRIKPRFTNEEFTKLLCLRYLRVDGVDLSGDFENLFSQLRWLNWRGCPPYFKLTNFYMKNLVILDLSNSGITEDWDGWNHIKMANKLKVLQLANCALRRTPDFSSYASLEILILRRCESLVEIDQSIGNMKNLKILDISYSDIRRLPDEIWMLEKLEVIDFTCSSYLRGDIPSNMGRLSSLRFLSFRDTEIQSLPTSMGELSCLQTLNLGGCTELQSHPELPSSLRVLYVASIPNLTNLVNLQELHFVGGEYVEIPRDIGLLSKLEKLTLDSTNIRTLPKEIGDFSQLKVLNVRLCDDLQCILGLPSSLVDLSLALCDSLERLPDLSNLKNLLKFSLNTCVGLTEVQGLGNLESLTSLDINACDKLANLEKMRDLSNLKKLEILCITDCLELLVIQGLDKLESLKYLDLHDCENLLEIEGLDALESVEVLNLSGCTSLGTKPNPPNAHTQQCKDQIYYHADSMYRYWTALREERLSSRLQVVSGYTYDEGTQEEL